MNILKKKKILICGITNIFSISWSIAKIMYQQGAELAFVYKNKKLKKRIKKLAKEVNSNIILQCNVNSDFEIKKLFSKLSKYWKNFDGIVHSIAYSSPEQLQHKYINVINRKDFLIAHEISSYSLLALVKESFSLLNKNSSILTLSYLGSIKCIPYYNVMGSAKASLEANVRYLSYYAGKKNIKVNAISSGPIKTTSSYIIKDFKKICLLYKKYSPLKRNITAKEIGNVATFLCSNLSSGITGQIIYVDAGFNISGIFL